MRVGVLGSGDVAKVLASGFLKHGHEVMLGTREPSKLADWGTSHPAGRVGGMAEQSSANSWFWQSKEPQRQTHCGWRATQTFRKRLSSMRPIRSRMPRLSPHPRIPTKPMGS
jgi:hypothetical protein